MGKGGSGRVEVTAEGRSKLCRLNGKAIAAGVQVQPTVEQPPVVPLPTAVVVEAKQPPADTSGIEKTLAEYRELLSLYEEEVAVNEAAVQGMNAQIPLARTRVEQAQRDLDVLLNRRDTVQAKIEQARKGKEDLLLEIEREQSRLTDLQRDFQHSV